MVLNMGQGRIYKMVPISDYFLIVTSKENINSKNFSEVIININKPRDSETYLNHQNHSEDIKER